MFCVLSDAPNKLRHTFYCALFYSYIFTLFKDFWRTLYKHVSLTVGCGGSGGRNTTSHEHSALRV